MSNAFVQQEAVQKLLREGAGLMSLAETNVLKPLFTVCWRISVR
jgi:hypothetical protein